MRKMEHWKIALALAFLVIFGYATVRFIAGIPQDSGLNSVPELSIPQNLGIKTGSPLGGQVTFESGGVHYDDLSGLWDREIGGLNFMTWADDRLLVASTAGRVMALDPLNGDILWSFNVGSWIASHPTYVDGVVYFGSVDHRLYALDAKKGTLNWVFRAEGEILSPPRVIDGMVYFVSDNNLIYDLKTRVYAVEAKEGKQVWTYDTKGWISASPAYGDGLVYLGTYTREAICLEATAGLNRWSSLTASLVFTSPLAGDGVVYYSCIDGNVYALAAEDGKTLWQNSLGEFVWLPPVSSQGILLLGSYNQNIFALDSASGDKLWTYNLRDVLDFPLQPSGEQFYAFTATGNVYVMGLKDGALQRAYHSGYSFNTTPILVNGVVFASTNDGHVRAFQVPPEPMGNDL